MLVKLYPILLLFARRKEAYADRVESVGSMQSVNNVEHVDRAARTEKAERTEKPMTHKEWINVDRIVMLVLVLGVIIAAIIFS